MITRAIKWMEQMSHRMRGHLLVTVLTPMDEYSFYASSVYQRDGVWYMDDLGADGTVELKPEHLLSVTVTGA